MKAVVYEDVRTVGVHEVADAGLEADSDAVVRVTSSALCGSDLHMYDGRTGASAGLVLGHEPLGVVEQVGPCVQTITVGMRVVMPTHLYCGTCPMCAREVYSVDGIDTRLDKAGELGATPIDFRDSDPVDQIHDLRARAGLPIGQEKLGGVDKVIDAVGFQAHDRAHPDTERPDQVITDAARLVNTCGTVAVIGVYPQKDLDPQPGETADGRLTVPWATFFNKGVTVRFGRTHDRRYTTHLRDLITSGRARPATIITHHAALDDAPQLYRQFDNRENGIIKAVLHP